MWQTRKEKTIQRENNSVVSMGWKEALTLRGRKGNCWGDGTVLDLDCGGGYQTMCVFKNHKNLL